MTAITILSDFEAQKNKVSHCFHCFPIYLPSQGLLNATSFNVLWRVGFPLEEDGGQRAHYSRAVILLKTTVSICKARTMYQILQSTFQFSSVTQLCPTLCDPMNRSTPGLPVHHQLLEFTQAHVHQVGDATQLSHPLSSPSPPDPNPSQHQGLADNI